MPRAGKAYGTPRSTCPIRRVREPARTIHVAPASRPKPTRRGARTARPRGRFPTSRARHSRRVANALPSRSCVEPLISKPTPRCLVAPSMRLARLTECPSGPYLNFLWLPVLPTRAGPEFKPIPRPNAPAQPAFPAAVELGQAVPHRQGGAAGPHGVIGLVDRGVPHRQQSVADVIDHHARRLHDPGREVFHDLADQLAGQPGGQPFRHAGEAANVGEQHGHLALAALEQRPVAVERGGQVGREELLELDPASRRLRLAFLPRQPGRDGRGQHLGQLGLERANLG